MKPNVKLIRKKRVFSEEYQREIVRLYESGKFSALQLQRLYGINIALIYKWIYKFSQFNEPGYRVIEMKQSSTVKVKALEQRIAPEVRRETER